MFCTTMRSDLSKAENQRSLMQWWVTYLLIWPIFLRYITGGPQKTILLSYDEKCNKVYVMIFFFKLSTFSLHITKKLK